MTCLLHFPHWSRQIKNSGIPPTSLSIPLAYIWDLRHFLIFSSRTHLSARWWIIKTLSLFRKEGESKRERERERRGDRRGKHDPTFLFHFTHPPLQLAIWINTSLKKKKKTDVMWKTWIRKQQDAIRSRWMKLDRIMKWSLIYIIF